MRWRIHGERQIYDDPWLDLWLYDVEQPDGRRYEHHVIKLRHLAVTVLLDEQRRVLLLWRHRFVTDTWAWELPMGLIEAGESPEEAAVREAVEETGWRPGTLRPLIYSEPANGITDAEHHVFLSEDAVWSGPPTEVNEAERIEWVPLTEVLGMVQRREIVSGATLVGLLALLADRAAPAAPPVPPAREPSVS
ncbi:NUDIX hydrolase [Streptomyces sp. DSM 44915]|uniref:NUDIX hydrolase n=1 Tax=Streptomyces chisholmiae TaxID=3075540 RepID=A0ABU2JPK0_9ACTN|nr:NUDIX hydrolase [Streptomyces sp. DSM 44915]MDT0266911.1 NUDIX hydrolase [Streptomyces sp. DSM 44915]